MAFSRSRLDGDLSFFPVVQFAAVICPLWCVSLPYPQLDTNLIPKRGSHCTTTRDKRFRSHTGIEPKPAPRFRQACRQAGSIAETGALVLWVSSLCIWLGFVSTHVPVVDCAYALKRKPKKKHTKLKKTAAKKGMPVKKTVRKKLAKKRGTPKKKLAKKKPALKKAAVKTKALAPEDNRCEDADRTQDTGSGKKPERGYGGICTRSTESEGRAIGRFTGIVQHRM